MKNARFTGGESGFSLLEMLVAVLLLLIVSGAAFEVLSYYQKNYVSTQLRIDMDSSLRGALELLTQEIDQAGALSFTPRKVTAPPAITASSTAQSVTLDSTTDIFVGEKLLIDAGGFQELVSVAAVDSTTISGIFTQNHTAGARVMAVGVFPQGIMSSSNSTQLQVFGDIYGDGSLTYAQYSCDTTAGTFSRSVTPVMAAPGTASTTNSMSKVLIANVIPNAGGTPCFRYQTQSISGSTFVTSVGITITIQSAQKDPQTNNYITLSKSFLNISPRNVLVALDEANSAIVTRLQPTPTNLPLS